jgi:gas vesicle protein
MAQHKGQSGGETFSFVGGLILGFIVSAPIVAWLSPRSGEETRRDITQRGMIIRRRVRQTVRKPLEQVQQQLKGDSIQEALEEGKTIAARLQSGMTANEGGSLNVH